MSDLPELTDEERAAMNAMDMTEILGTWEERHDVAMKAAVRWFRERNNLEALLREVVANGPNIPCDLFARIERQVGGE